MAVLQDRSKATCNGSIQDNKGNGQQLESHAKHRDGYRSDRPWVGNGQNKACGLGYRQSTHLASESLGGMSGAAEASSSTTACNLRAPVTATFKAYDKVRGLIDNSMED
jgi:hypothetical protein